MEIVDRYVPGAGREVGLLGVPLGFGAGTVGSELGVAAMKLAKFRGDRLVQHIESLGYGVEDYGDVEIVNPTRTAEPGENPKYLAEITESCANMAQSVKRILADGKLPVILGGDHSIATGTFSGVSSYFRSVEEEIGLIWFDAHADMNTLRNLAEW